MMVYFTIYGTIRHDVSLPTLCRVPPYRSKAPNGSLSEVAGVIPLYNASMFSAVRDRGEITRQPELI